MEEVDIGDDIDSSERNRLGFHRDNEAQRKALRHLLADNKNLFRIVLGPPGTGKSHVGIRVVERLLGRSENCQVLFLSASGQVLDQSLKAIRDKLNLKAGRDVLRVGLSSLYNDFHLLEETQTSEREDLTLSSFLDLSSRACMTKSMKRNVSEMQQKQQRQPVDNVIHGEKSRLSKVRLLSLIQQDQLRPVLNDAIARAQAKKKRLKEDMMAKLSKAKVVGATIRGARSLSDVLMRVKFDVVIVEEAGNVHEASLLTCLPKSASKVVLLGDTRQLRPYMNHGVWTKHQCAADCTTRAKVVDLSRELVAPDISILARLCNLDSEVATLVDQYRVPANIMEYLRSGEQYWPLYSPAELQDACVKDSFEMTSMLRCEGESDEDFELNGRFMMINHPYKEDKLASNLSYSNHNESKLAVRLAEWLLKQGLSSSRIQILSMYAVQCEQLRQSLHARSRLRADHDMRQRGLADRRTADLGCVSVATVDGFQGLEADVIILCFARSKLDSSCRWVCDPQRLSVAWSRARMAMFALGNFESLCQHRAGHPAEDVLGSIVRRARATNRYVEDYKLQLLCRQHPEARLSIDIRATKGEQEGKLLLFPKDFDRCSYDGGCNAGGSYIHSCQHQLQLSCHFPCPQELQCLSPCLKSFTECRHQCLRAAGQGGAAWLRAHAAGAVRGEKQHEGVLRPAGGEAEVPQEPSLPPSPPLLAPHVRHLWAKLLPGVRDELAVGQVRGRRDEGRRAARNSLARPPPSSRLLPWSCASLTALSSV
eukprot:753886-Hanusia_phi.AAC.3